MPADAPNDHDVLANHLALHNAQQLSSAKALAAQFADFDSESSSSSSSSSRNDDTAREEQLKARTSETAGVGYTAPPSSADTDASSRHDSAATARLRRQMLGKNARAPSTTVGRGSSFAASTARPRPESRRRQSSDDDEDGGRSSVGKARRAPPAVRGDVETGVGGEGLQAETAPATGVTATENARAPGTTTTTKMGKKRGVSYLDQVLAERAAKKQKKKKKNQEGGEGSQSHADQT